MLTVIAGCTGILGDLPSLAGIPQVLLCPSGTICTWEHGRLLSSVWADTDDLLKPTWGHPAGKGPSPVAVRWSQSRCLLRTCPKTHWIYPAFSQSLLSQDQAPSAFVVGWMQGKDHLSSGIGLAPLSVCPRRKKDHGLRGCAFKNTCSLQVIVMLQCVQHFSWAQYKVQWFKAGRSGGIQQIQNYLFL